MVEVKRGLYINLKSGKLVRILEVCDFDELPEIKIQNCSTKSTQRLIWYDPRELEVLKLANLVERANER